MRRVYALIATPRRSVRERLGGLALTYWLAVGYFQGRTGEDSYRLAGLALWQKFRKRHTLGGGE